jgi:uncharacterized membrane protein
VTVATRILADLLFRSEEGGAPGLLVAALALATAGGSAVGSVLFGVLAGLPPVEQWLATAILALLTQMWVANLFLSATRRYTIISAAYLAGIIAGACALIAARSVPALLAGVAVAVIVVDAILLIAIRRTFAAAPVWPRHLMRTVRRHAHLGAAGMAAALAIWVDKWLLWFAPDGSLPAIGHLRLNPIYDGASFLGLLSLVPGVTLLLLAVETRFDRAFSGLMATCAGGGTVARIGEARRELARVMLDDVRLLVVVQATFAALLWVAAPRIIEATGGDVRGTFALRLTVAGAVFHLVVTWAATILSYYDLFARILLVWAVFAVVSLVATLAVWEEGFVAFGWGYLAGAIAGACAGVALVAQATDDLLYLLFVSNNPAVMADRRYWA